MARRAERTDSPSRWGEVTSRGKGLPSCRTRGVTRLHRLVGGVHVVTTFFSNSAFFRHSLTAGYLT